MYNLKRIKQKKPKKHCNIKTPRLIFFRKLFPQYEICLEFFFMNETKQKKRSSRDNFFVLFIRQSKRYIRIESPGLYMWKTVVNINTFVLIKIKTILLKATLIHSNGAYLCCNMRLLSYMFFFFLLFLFCVSFRNTA